MVGYHGIYCCGGVFYTIGPTTLCNDVMKKLSEAGREELALALILLKDFKSAGKFDPDMIMRIIEFADYLGVRAEFDKLISQIPPLKIEERYP